jgi:hypothetical protein
MKVFRASQERKAGYPLGADMEMPISSSPLFMEGVPYFTPPYQPSGQRGATGEK